MKTKWLALSIVACLLLLAGVRYARNWKRYRVLHNQAMTLLAEVEDKGGVKRSGPLGLILDLREAQIDEDWLMDRIGQLTRVDELWLPQRLETPAVVSYLEENEKMLPAKVSFLESDGK